MRFYLFLIPLFPLLGALWNAIFGYKLQKKYGEKPIHLVAISMPLLSFAVSLWGFITLLTLDSNSRLLSNHLFSMINIEYVSVNMAFSMDQLSAIMALVVTGVGSLIHIYATTYMKGDKSYWRFFTYMNVFLFAMLLLVLGDNLILMFFGWEGVGFASFALIGFWYEDYEKASAGMKAFIVNRVGDFGFLIGFFLLFWGISGAWEDNAYRLLDNNFTVSFKELAILFSDKEFVASFVSREVFGISIATIIPLLLFVGAMGKSAQIPLYVWLPDAMAGPTPVSALIHAATMVTSGVYMISRLNFLFSISPWVMVVVSGIGALTALFAASIALVQRDIKKVLAYSTVSQLGYMFIAVGVGAYWAGIFHLMTHAFFKALLFLGAGSVIMGMHHEQDMFYMGGLKEKMPKTFRVMQVATYAIAGLPFASGFFSKDEILWKAFSTKNFALSWWPYLIWAMGTLAALFTAFYMYRLYYMTFSGKNRADRIPAENLHHHGEFEIKESPNSVIIPLMILAFLSAFAGFIGMPHVFHLLPNYLEHWLSPVFTTSYNYIVSSNFSVSVEIALMILSVLLAFTGWFVARLLYKDNELLEDDPANIPARLKKIALLARLHKLLYNKYYVDEIYFVLIINNVLRLTNVLAWIDTWIIDGLVNLSGLLTRFTAYVHSLIDTYIVDGLVNFVASSTMFLSSKVRKLQFGNIQAYVIALSAGLVLIMIFRYILL